VATREVLLHPKNALVLTSLKDDTKKWYASSLARQSGLSYVYVTELLSIFEKDGIIGVKKEGKVRRVSLTEKGQKLVVAIEELNGRLAALAPPEQPKPAPAAREETPEGKPADAKA